MLTLIRRGAVNEYLACGKLDALSYAQVLSDHMPLLRQEKRPAICIVDVTSFPTVYAYCTNTVPSRLCEFALTVCKSQPNMVVLATIDDNAETITLSHCAIPV